MKREMNLVIEVDTNAPPTVPGAEITAPSGLFDLDVSTESSQEVTEEVSTSPTPSTNGASQATPPASSKPTGNPGPILDDPTQSTHTTNNHNTTQQLATHPAGFLGIILGVSLGIAVLLLVLIFAHRRRKRQKDEDEVLMQVLAIGSINQRARDIGADGLRRALERKWIAQRKELAREKEGPGSEERYKEFFRRAKWEERVVGELE